MDFFDRQEASRRATRHLVLLFGAAFLAVGFATGTVLLLAFGFASNGTAAAVMAPSFTQLLIDSADMLAVIVAVVVGLMIIASLFRAATLSQGGGHVARMLGGTQIQPDDSDPLHQRLINVVEEMALASGLPVPEVYVLEAESGINAFAAGLTTDDAAVAVTRGCLDHLSRAELQGVIAHEFSHILNGDMRLNLKLMGFSFGILVLSLVGRWLLRASSRGVRVSSRGKGNPMIFIGLGLTVIGAIGVLLSRLIKAAVSRQREVLADASAVQFTREPLALAGALKKIGGFTPFIKSVETEEVSHMLFGRAGRSFAGWFATHPPLDERIRALDPGFEAGDYTAPTPLGERTDDGFAAAAGVSALSGSVREPGIESAGTIEAAAGVALRHALSGKVVDAAHSSQSAWLLVLALGLEPGGGTQQERSLLETQLGAQRAAQCFALRAELDTMEPGLLLPLFEMSVPALKGRPAEHIEFLFELLSKLAAADGTITLFEYLLQRTLQAHLLPEVHGHASRPERRQAGIALLATVAVRGQREPEAIESSFAAGLKALRADNDDDTAEVLKRTRNADTFDDFDTALDQLASAPASERRDVLKALAVTIRRDQRVDIREAEMFRAIAAVLGCPVPPLQVIS